MDTNDGGATNGDNETSPSDDTTVEPGTNETNGETGDSNTDDGDSQTPTDEFVDPDNTGDGSETGIDQENLNEDVDSTVDQNEGAEGEGQEGNSTADSTDS